MGRLGATRIAADVPESLPLRFNIAPGERVLTALDVRSGGALERTLAMPRWGFVPRWARDPSIGNRLVNARAETVTTTPAFRDAWSEGHRCLILADVFYEWQKLPEPRKKQPWAIRLSSGEPFAFAGLWDRWQDRAHPDEPPIVTVTIITTAANELVRPVHHRMPVMLTGEALAEWVDRDVPAGRADELLLPYSAAAMEAWRITTRVNAPVNDDADVLTPAADTEPDSVP